MSDARGGGGGGGGGALELRTLEEIRILAGAKLLANGGAGGGGESLGSSDYGGPGGGGAGGVLVLKSAKGVTVAARASLEVTGAFGGNPNQTKGKGGDGLVQLQVPRGQIATVSGNPILPVESWTDPTNTLNPSEITPESVAISRWLDMGRVIRREPAGTNPIFRFSGTGAAGKVLTDLAGYIENPEQKPFGIDYLGLRDPASGQFLSGEEPRPNYIPENAEVFIHFQAADALSEGSKEVDPLTITPWDASPAVANNKQFIRYRITFNVSKNGETISDQTRRPVVQRLRLDFEF
jgi:hypothetical protein